MALVPLTQKLVDRAIAGGVAVEVGDLRTRGLFLRVRAGGRWTWNWRRRIGRKDYRRDLGADWTLDEAQGLAAELNAYVATTRFPDDVTVDLRFADWIERRRARKRGVPYTPPPPQPEPETGTTWRDAATAWVEDLHRRRRDATADGYRKDLNVAELRPLHDRRVGGITREMAAEAIAAISARGVERQAETSAIAVRKFFQWMGEDSRTRKYGVAPGVMKTLRAPERTLDETDAKPLHVPSGPEVGRIVRWLRGDNGLERDRLAGLLLVYTVQRRRPVASARVADFRDVEGVPCWIMPPMHRKTASIRRRRGVDVGSHVLPLPPQVVAVVERAKALAGKSEYLFPGMRPRRAGATITHMDPSLLTHMFGAIPGCQASPHDLRRALATTYKRAAGLRLGDVKLILDHSEDVEPDDVTAQHYAFDPRIGEKTNIMGGWCDWVDAQTCAVLNN